ncbi:MAG: UDP-N-acetylglucosamine 2-epimerase [Gammaproteobacteria bacterium]|nr:UDP-N-acetylglucosamine 2-epimerase [Gammaproteobacteria bacterium]
MNRKKICVITGSRAEYGLLQPVMRKIKNSEIFDLQVIATGSHLEKEFGYTYREIESDSFLIDRKIEIHANSSSDVAVANSMSLCLIGVASALKELSPDLAIVLGDRYEILAAAQAAMVCHIPIAHIGGGDVAVGTYDNIIRHCITKLASIHFVTHQDAFNRVLQLGENPNYIYNVGSTCVENARSASLLTKKALEDQLEISLGRNIAVVTFHPLTMSVDDGADELEALLGSIDLICKEPDSTVVFTKANADQGGHEVNLRLEGFVKDRPNCHLFDSLGYRRYLSLVKLAKVVVGNSSSGIYEAPYLMTPTVDVGQRQMGRKAPASVFRADGSKGSIENALKLAFSFSFDNTEMIYGDGSSSQLIFDALSSVKEFSPLIEKEFFDRS